MEFYEKLQKLRTDANLTQEELAEKLFVSRAAISKWESGRGYPNIDSLKAIAKHFNITIDELIGGDEIVTLAERNIEESNKKYSFLICGVLDCLTALLFFLPLFGNGGAENAASVSLFSITDIESWLKIVFIVIISLSVANGFCGAVISNFDKPVWNKHRLLTGIGLSIIGTAVFIMTRQPYAGIFYLFLLVIKGILLIKRK